MIFVGDIAVPEGIKPNIDYLPDTFKSSLVIANLEGTIVPNNSVSTTETKLFNSEHVVEFLKQLNVTVVSLGNNHITDVPEAFQFTRAVLDEHNIAYCGAGDNLEEAGSPVIVNIDGNQYAFLSFGWNVINCKYARKARFGCSPLSTKWVLQCIGNVKAEHPDAKIIVLPHWDYELELYPQPMHRELARLAIDAGAVGVFGHHPHCVQGIEIYKEAPIVYSLGNWFIPDGVYFNKKLMFPDISKIQLAIEWNKRDLICHWFQYCPYENTLKFLESISAQDCERIKGVTPFWGMANTAYVKWFKENRRKKKGLPIYKNVYNEFGNELKSHWVLARQDVIKLLLKMKLKRGPH